MLFIKTLEEFLLENFTEKYHYSYNCIVPTDYDELIFIIDNMKEIHPSTFFRYVDLSNTGFDKNELQKDYHVSFYKCKNGTIDCYVMKHSAIEYVFKKGESASNIDTIKTVKKNSLKKGTDYELVSNHNGYKVGDETSFGIIKNIFHYLDTDKYQYEIKDGNKVNYYNSSVFETNEKLNTSTTIYTNISVNIGDIYEESDIYNYVQSLHEDFYEGDLGKRIEKFKYYRVEEIEISKIGISEFQLNDDVVDDYISKYDSIKTYPPIVLCPYNKRFDQYRIIDGTHRANALYNAGQKTIISFVGIKNK